MAIIVRMPSVLAGAEEAAIATWLVSQGDRVEVGDPLAEIETEKANVEYNAEESGIVGRLVLQPGDAAAIGDPIAVLVEEGEPEGAIDEALGGHGPAPAVTVPQPESSTTAERDPESADLVVEAPSVEQAAEAAVPAEPVTATTSDAPASGAAPGRLFISPIARKLAKEKGIDLATVTGSGPDGRIVRRDIDAIDVSAGGQRPREAAVAPAAAAATPQETGDWELIPHTGMRRAIARRLTESTSTVPHFYLSTECRVDELLALRARINETSPVKISVNDLVVKAVAAAFSDVPEANVTWSDDGLRRHRTVDISVAVATEGGLVTPVIHDVGAKSLSTVAAAIADVASKAREKRLKQHELEGGSFAVSNLGMFGTTEFSAIINPPQSGILAVGAAKQQPVVTDGQLAVATVMRCTLSADHRAIDGALAAQWLAAFTARVENPLGILV